MFFVPKNTATRRPAAVWSGFPPRSRTRRTTVQPSGCRLHARRPFRIPSRDAAGQWRCPWTPLDAAAVTTLWCRSSLASTCHSHPGPGCSVRQGLAPGGDQPSRLDGATVSRWSRSTLRGLNARRGFRPWRRPPLRFGYGHRFPCGSGPTLRGFGCARTAARSITTKATGLGCGGNRKGRTPCPMA